MIRGSGGTAMSEVSSNTLNQPAKGAPSGIEKATKLWQSCLVQSIAQNSNILCSRIYSSLYALTIDFIKY